MVRDLSITFFMTMVLDLVRVVVKAPQVGMVLVVYLVMNMVLVLVLDLVMTMVVDLVLAMVWALALSLALGNLDDD